MQDLAELERRINAALQRIATGIEAGVGTGGEAAVPVDAPAATSPAAQDEIAGLKAELTAERDRANALAQQLESAQKLAAQKTAAPKPAGRAGTPSELEARVEQLTRQVDVQGLEMQRMRKNVVQLRENLRALRRSATDALADPELINRAMQAELESIRVTRFAEMAELDEIIAELDPLIASPNDPIAPEVSGHA